MEKKLFSALSSFQKKCPVIHKGTQGYGYSYADLPAIFEIINPILSEFNLGFTQPICGSKVKTIVFHVETGETIESETDIPQNVQLKGMNDFQVLGSAITYIRRYALSSILGIITDKDNDAAGEQQKNQQAYQARQNGEKKPLIRGTEPFEKVMEWIAKTPSNIDKVKANYIISDADFEFLKRLVVV